MSGDDRALGEGPEEVSTSSFASAQSGSTTSGGRAASASERVETSAPEAGLQPPSVEPVETSTPGDDGSASGVSTSLRHDDLVPRSSAQDTASFASAQSGSTTSGGRAASASERVETSAPEAGPQPPSVEAVETPHLTHVDESGAARMVDVSAKDVTTREATATGRVLVSAEVVALLRAGDVPKGDALGVARVAGIMAAKRTPDLVPLCHPLAISGVTVDLDVHDDHVAIAATVRTTDRTGVEMEALTAVSVAALTVVDMVKAVDKGAVIADVRVEAKSGGRSGEWRRE
ncbi:hypothetical protein GCM10011519_27850 [Marmoricola endophyticus]|uniref:Cyclic pyranopterin monophosphate synthase n=1 Tax=Marmoricola endophyticus TaxID=2040280 RepID=A0A917BP39_9ACTN|nr:hypothetical protein GCM10011519_27850 [Marmoricola endophyticus]